MNSKHHSMFPCRVDIVLCTYNRAHLIGNAIESVQRQSYRYWHLIVVDDFSTDNSRALIERLASKDSRIEYLKTTHGGVAHARNVGIRHSRSPFVTFIDADDTYLPDHLLRRVDYFRHHPEVDLVHGGVKLLGAERDHYVVDARNPTRLIHIEECCVGASLFGKRSVFDTLGGFRLLDYSSESDFLERASREFTVQKVEFPTYCYHLYHEDRRCKAVGRNIALSIKQRSEIGSCEENLCKARRE